MRGQDRLECFYLRGESFIAELIGRERELFVAYARNSVTTKCGTSFTSMS